MMGIEFLKFALQAGFFQLFNFKSPKFLKIRWYVMTVPATYWFKTIFKTNNNKKRNKNQS